MRHLASFSIAAVALGRCPAAAFIVLYRSTNAPCLCSFPRVEPGPWRFFSRDLGCCPINNWSQTPQPKVIAKVGYVCRKPVLVPRPI